VNKDEQVSEGWAVEATTVHGSHHGLTVVVTSSPGSFSYIASCCFILDRGICHDMPVLAGCGCPLFVSLIIKASEIILLSIHLGLKGLNLESKPKKENTKCNRENKGVNHKIKHVNP